MKIVVVAPSWIGDAIVAQPLIRVLKQRHPETVVDVVANRIVAPVYTRMAEVDGIFDSPLKHGQLNWSGICQTADLLSKRHYDEAIVLPNSFKSALITWRAKIPVRRGFLGEARFFLLNEIVSRDPKRRLRLVDRYLMLADSKSSPIAANDAFSPPNLASSPETQGRLLARFGLADNNRFIAFCPGAEYGPAKRWPVEHYGILAHLLVEQGYLVCLVGSEKDREIGQAIVAASGVKPENCKNLCGETTLDEAIDLLAAAAFAVTNDSGLMHVAASVGTPLVAIYGSTDPNYTPPLSESAIVVQNPQPCSPCFKRTCRYDHYRCLKSITPETVFQNITGISAPRHPVP